MGWGGYQNEPAVRAADSAGRPAGRTAGTYQAGGRAGRLAARTAARRCRPNFRPKGSAAVSAGRTSAGRTAAWRFGRPSRPAEPPPSFSAEDRRRAPPPFHSDELAVTMLDLTAIWHVVKGNTGKVSHIMGWTDKVKSYAHTVGTQPVPLFRQKEVQPFFFSDCFQEVHQSSVHFHGLHFFFMKDLQSTQKVHCIGMRESRYLRRYGGGSIQRIRCDTVYTMDTRGVQKAHCSTSAVPMAIAGVIRGVDPCTPNRGYRKSGEHKRHLLPP